MVPSGAGKTVFIECIAGIHKAEMPSELAREMDLIIGREIYVVLKLRRLKVLGNRNSIAPEQFEWYNQEII